ncbi:MAG: tRNA epoxyqueuosine(34) reductase QueG [Verrucomicrobiota bacterium]
MNDLKTRLMAKAQELGFADCRVAVAAEASRRELYEQWVAEGKHGDMAWMARNMDRRGDPRLVQPGAQSVIVLAMNYFQGPPPREPGYRIARYAWNDDYHDLIEAKLKTFEAWLIEQGGVQRRYVDTGPVLERNWASEAGLGWGGKSTMQIHRQLGTWFFLAELITTLEIEPDAPAKDHCGSCTRCIVACPTQAITAPRRLDARRCVSYLTIENKGPIPLEFRRAIGDRLYGCDDCLSACPWNKFAQVSHEATFQARQSVFGMSLRDFLTLTDESFRALFAKSPIKRIKRHAFLRNVCVVLGNVGTPEDLPALLALVDDQHPLIAEHAAWAVAEIRERNQTSREAVAYYQPPESHVAN